MPCCDPLKMLGEGGGGEKEDWQYSQARTKGEKSRCTVLIHTPTPLPPFSLYYTDYECLLR